MRQQIKKILRENTIWDESEELRSPRQKKLNIIQRLLFRYRGKVIKTHFYGEEVQAEILDIICYSRAERMDYAIRVLFRGSRIALTDFRQELLDTFSPLHVITMEEGDSDWESMMKEWEEYKDNKEATYYKFPDNYSPVISEKRVS